MIRKAKPDDYQKLTDLWLKTSLKAHHFVEADYWQNMAPTVEKYYLPNAETYVFEDRRQIKGFISLIENNHIGALFVAPEFQRQKIGRKLLTYVRRKRPALNLKVFVKNVNALRFYQAAGFKLIAEQIEETTQEKELVMSWAQGCLSGFQKRFQGDS